MAMWRRVVVGVGVLVASGCSFASDDSEVAQTHESWVSATRSLLSRGLTATPEDATLLLPPTNGDDLYASALAVQALAREGELADDDWEVFAKRTQRVVDDQGLKLSVAGPTGTALELVKAALYARRTLVSKEFEQSLLATPPPDDTDIDVYDGIAALELAGIDGRDLPTLRSTVGMLARKEISREGCASSETLFLLGALATVHELNGLCPEGQVTALVADQLSRATSEVAEHPRFSGLPHAEVVLAASRLEAAGVTVVQDTLVGTARALVNVLSRRSVPGVSVTSGVLAQAQELHPMGVPLGEQLVAHLHSVVRAGGELQTVTLAPPARALLARTLRLLGQQPDPSLIEVPTTLSSRSRLEVALADGESTDPATLTRLVESLLREGVKPLADGRHPEVTVLLRAVNRLEGATCQLPGLSDVIAAVEERTNNDDQDLALALRWQHICGHPNSERETTILRDAVVFRPLKEGAPGVEHLLQAWQSAAVLCALAPERLEPDTAWNTYRTLADRRAASPAATP